MPQVGDRYVIEIAEITKGAVSGNTKYRIKGFDNLVFDDKGLRKLISYDQCLQIELSRAKREAEEASGIRVGDEISGGIFEGVVTRIEKCNDGLCYTILSRDGSCHVLTEKYDNVKKTGYFFPVADIFKKSEQSVCAK